MSACLVTARRVAARSLLRPQSRHALCKPSRAIWAGPLRPRLLRLAEQWPEAPPSLPQARPLLDAVCSLRRLEEDREELSRQRGVEAERELLELYDSEIEAVEDRILDGTFRLETELLHVASSGGVRCQAADERRSDGRGAVVELTPGVGGQEAMLFAAELWAMYERFAESRGWTFSVERHEEVISGKEAGLMSGAARVIGSPDQNGCGPFGWLRSESGVHRVQRVPTTDRKGRMQTSSAAVVVLPLADEADMVLGKADVRIDISKKSSGPGGQSVNAAHQAIRATHIPTGMQVHVSSSPSQHENRIRALQMLRTKLLWQQISAQNDLDRTDRKQQSGTRDRSEKMRTYNFQRDEVVDHILGKVDGVHFGATDLVLGGGLSSLLEAHQARDRQFGSESALDSIEAKLQAEK